MAKSVFTDVAEFLFTWFGVLDFLTKTSWNGQYKPKWNSGGKRSSWYSPRSFSSTPFSSGSNTNPKKKKKNELNAYTLEGLKVMNINATKIRTNYSWLKSWYTPKNKNIFSWLK